MRAVRMIAAAALVMAIFSGCSYSTNFESPSHGGYDPDDSSGFRLPEFEELSPDDIDEDVPLTGSDTDLLPEERGYKRYETDDGRFTFQVPEEMTEYSVDSGLGTMIFTFGENKDTVPQSDYIIISGGMYLQDIFSEMLEASGSAGTPEDSATVKKYRINNRDAVVRMEGTIDPVAEKGDLDLTEITCIKYDEYEYITVTANTTSAESREDFYRKRLIVKDVISSIRYLGGE